MTPISQALPADPPPWRTNARRPRRAPAPWRRPAADPGRTPAGRRPRPRRSAELKKVLYSWEPPFANCLAGAPGGDYLSRGIVDCRGAPTADTAFMGLTSCRWITITGTIAHRRRGVQPGSSRLPCRWQTHRRLLHPHL
jgi:hypothetical protein